MNSNRWTSLALLILLLIAGIIGAVFFLFNNKNKADIDKDQALQQIQAYILEKDHKAAYRLAEDLVIKYPEDDNLSSLKKALAELLGESTGLNDNLKESSISTEWNNDPYTQVAIEPITPRPDYAENIFTSSEPKNNEQSYFNEEKLPTPIKEDEFKSSLDNGLATNESSSTSTKVAELTPIKKPEEPKKQEPSKEEPKAPVITPPVQETPVKKDEKPVVETPTIKEPTQENPKVETPVKPAPAPITEAQKRKNEERKIRVLLFEALDSIQTGELKVAANKLDKLIKDGSIEPDYKKVIDFLNINKQEEARRQMENLLDSGVIFPFIDMSGARKLEDRASAFDIKEVENQSFSNAQEREKAKKEFEALLKKNPKDAKTLGVLASIAEAEGNRDKAISLYEQAIAISPNADDYYALGNLYFYEKNYNQAIANYDNSIKLNPKNARAYNNKGISYVILNQDNNAISSFKEAVKVDPKYANGYYQLGRVQKRNNDLKGALASFQSAYNLDKSQISIVAELANTYLELGQYKEADQYYTIALKMDPKNESLLYNSAQAKLNLKQNKEALALIEKALATSPNNTSYKELKVEILSKM